MIASCIGVRPRCRVGIFRRKHDLVTVALDKFTKKALAFAVSIKICRVKEIATRFPILFIHVARLFLRRSPSPLLTKCHGAERKLRHPQTAASKEPVFHACPCDFFYASYSSCRLTQNGPRPFSSLPFGTISR